MRKGAKRAKGRATGAGGKRVSAASQSRPSGKVQEDLAVEIYTRLRLALVEIGVTPAQLRRAVERSWRLSSAPAFSGPL